MVVAPQPPPSLSLSPTQRLRPLKGADRVGQTLTISVPRDVPLTSPAVISMVHSQGAFGAINGPLRSRCSREFQGCLWSAPVTMASRQGSSEWHSVEGTERTHAHWALRVLSAQPWTRGWPSPGLWNSGAQTGVLVRQGYKDRTGPWRGRLRAARDACASEERWHRCCRRPSPGVPPAGSAKAEEPPRAREGRLAVGKGPREGGRSRG